MTQPGSTMANSSFFSSHSAVLTEMSYDPCHHSKLRKPSGTLAGPVPVFYMILMVSLPFFFSFFLRFVIGARQSLIDVALFYMFA